ncbi:hypothetical protein RB601_005013 [Gaeumannomyces tritici]
MLAVRENPRNGTQITSGNLIPGVGKMGLALPVGRMWRTGRTLRVKILNGSEKIQSKVPTLNCLSVPADQPTMNFGWLKDSTPEREFSRVITHEFGHALGCIHEHQSPATPILWNKKFTYEYYQSTQNWTKDEVDTNLFDHYASTTTQFSAFDPSSIMVYAIPSSMTTNGYSTAANDHPSETDKSFIANAYPTEARGLSALITMEVRAWDEPAKTASKRQIFSQELDTPPKLAVGLNWLDVANATNIRVHAYAGKLSKASADVHIDTWHDTTLYSAGCTWFTASQSRDPDFQVGEFSTQDDHTWDKPQPNTSRRINFERPYHAPPKVVVWLNQLDMAHDKNWRVKATATGVDAKGFTLHLDTWSNTTLYAAKAAWIAWPTRPAWPAASFPAGAFRDTPKVLIALNSLDIDCGKNLRLKLSANSVSKDGMT